jgi:type I restriction enzyme, S subunit
MVPEGWQKTPFGEVIRIANGQVDPKISPYAEMPHIGPENIESGTGKLSGVKTASECGLISGKYEFDEHAIVYSKIRPNLNKVAKPQFAGICSADMYPIWGYGGVSDTDFVFQLMLSDRFVAATTAVSLRTGMPKINRPDLTAIPILLPPLAEQKRIAEVLGVWDRAIAVAGQQLDLARTQKRALMQTLLTPTRRFPGFNGQPWKEVRLGDVGVTYGGLTGKTKDDFGEGNAVYIPYLNVFQNSRIDINRVDSVSIWPKEKQHIAQKGDVFFTTSSETPHEVGMSSVLLDECDNLYLNSFCFGYRFNAKNICLPEFARFLFRGKEFRRELVQLAQGATRYNLSKTALMKVAVKLPPIEEQRAIAATLETADAEITTLETQITRLQAEKKALMQQLLTGKKRLAV